MIFRAFGKKGPVPFFPNALMKVEPMAKRLPIKKWSGRGPASRGPAGLEGQRR
jgi:hypothetical protein